MKFKSGQNLTFGKFVSVCSSCDKKLPIHFVFYVRCTDRILVCECEECMIEHFSQEAL